MRVELPEVLMVEGLIEAEMSGDDGVALRVTFPVKPPVGVIVQLEVPLLPATKLTLGGVHDRLKSGCVNTTVIVAVVCVTAPLTPVTVAV